jgi:hypothetical protein
MRVRLICLSCCCRKLVFTTIACSTVGLQYAAGSLADAAAYTPQTNIPISTTAAGPLRAAAAAAAAVTSCLGLLCSARAGRLLLLLLLSTV